MAPLLALLPSLLVERHRLTKLDFLTFSVHEAPGDKLSAVTKQSNGRSFRVISRKPQDYDLHDGRAPAG